MEFSWWTWWGLIGVMVVGIALMTRSFVLSIREQGIGRARAERGRGAPWFWSGIGVLALAGVLLILWVVALDR